MIRRGPRPADSFVQIKNSALHDERLSHRARGYLASLLARPEGWVTSAERLAREGTEGRDAVRAALRELETFGYLVRIRTRNPDGTWSHDQFVTDEPGSIETPSENQ